MSLINDALKRASKTVPPVPPPAQTVAPLKPVLEPKRRIGVPVYALPLMLAAVLAMAFWFIMKGWQHGRPSNLTDSRLSVAAREIQTDDVAEQVAPKENLPSVSGETEPSARSSSGLTPFPGRDTAAPLTNSAAAATGTVDAVKIVFKLQAIFFRTSRPSAVVNNKPVYVGDKIGAARVLAITRDSVTLQSGRETNVLTLE